MEKKTGEKHFYANGHSNDYKQSAHRMHHGDAK